MAFGEGGLILHQGRSASVICSQDCNLAILSKEDYKMILQELQQEKSIIDK
jgi:CRP-like cAMP-binding protein